MVRIKKSTSFPGRKGSGKRFAACVRQKRNQPGVTDPEGLCSWIGRRKYGKGEFQKMAAKGKKRR